MGGGGRGDLIFPAPVGGGARLKALGFAVPETAPVRPAAESIPVPLVGLGFTLIRMVSPSYKTQLSQFHPETEPKTSLGPNKVHQCRSKSLPFSE